MSDTREAMHKGAINNNVDWSIQDDQLVVIAKNKALVNNKSWVISRNTGMIGNPKKLTTG